MVIELNVVLFKIVIFNITRTTSKVTTHLNH